MKQGFRLATAVCALSIVTLFTASSTKPAFAGDRSVPFFATFSGEAKFNPPQPPTEALFNGSGHATHMGSSTNMGVLAPLVFVPTNDCALGVGIPHTNMETLTAANGDQLVLEMIDLACPVDGTFMIFRGTGNWTVVHGTGRFAGATGSGTAAGGGDFIAGVFEFSLIGEISLPTGLRRR